MALEYGQNTAYQVVIRQSICLTNTKFLSDSKKYNRVNLEMLNVLEVHVAVSNSIALKTSNILKQNKPA